MDYSLALENRYLIDRDPRNEVGRGGMAVIYPGMDSETGEEIAAKTLLPAFQAHRERRERFLREASILEHMNSPYIVKWINTVNGRHGSWLIMERLHGLSLKNKLEAEGRFLPDVVNEWLAQAAAALDHVHGQGLVHLDVKPNNLFLTNDGDLKLIDFGIAQQAYRPPHREGQNLIGTTAYVAPEHVRGEPVTPQSDIFALGCVAAELLIGRPLFEQHRIQDHDGTANIKVPPESLVRDFPVAALPAWIDTVVGRALRSDPADRYASAAEFAEAFNDQVRPQWIRFRKPRKPVSVVKSSPMEIASPASIPVTHAEPSAPVAQRTSESSWLRRRVQRELRSTRRILLVFALMLMLVLGFPWYSGGVIDWAIGVMPGATTHVINGDLRMRSGPGTESELVVVLPDHQSITVTGLPVRTTATDHPLWWPVRTSMNGETYYGWVTDTYVERTWLMDRVADYQSTSESMRDWWDFLDSVIPGVVI